MFLQRELFHKGTEELGLEKENHKIERAGTR
jgi:hypothetical protein